MLPYLMHQTSKQNCQGTVEKETLNQQCRPNAILRVTIIVIIIIIISHIFPILWSLSTEPYIINPHDVVRYAQHIYSYIHIHTNKCNTQSLAYLRHGRRKKGRIIEWLPGKKCFRKPKTKHARTHTHANTDPFRSECKLCNANNCRAAVHAKYSL